MFRSDFVDIVKIAHQSSEKFYGKEENIGQANPFFIGFGNPNSDLLILGKEKGFETGNSEQLNFESIKNPNEWLHYIQNEIQYHKGKHYATSSHYLNAYIPYSGKMKSGHTWNKYSKLTSELFNKPALTENNSFLEYAFISEINHEPSKYSKIRKFDFQTRIDLLNNDFYKSFQKTILGCGNYLSWKTIEETFDVKFCEDYSKQREKLVLFKNGERKLILTRQLSMDIRNEFITTLVQLLK